MKLTFCSNAYSVNENPLDEVEAMTPQSGHNRNVCYLDHRVCSLKSTLMGELGITVE